MAEPSIISADIRDVSSTGEIERCQNPLEARKKAMDLLARREHSREELAKKLEAAGFEANAIVDALEALRKEGLQSDKRFVESFVQARVAQGKGPVRIRTELAQRGIRETCIDSALRNVDVDWDGLAREVRRRKFGRAMPDDFPTKAKQMRFLQYRGFESEQIQAAVGGPDD